MTRFKTKNLIREQFDFLNTFPEIAPEEEELGGDPNAPQRPSTEYWRLSGVMDKGKHNIDGFLLWQEVQAGADGKPGTINYVATGPGGVVARYDGQGNQQSGLSENDDSKIFYQFLADAFGVSLSEQFPAENWQLNPKAAQQGGYKVVQVQPGGANYDNEVAALIKKGYVKQPTKKGTTIKPSLKIDPNTDFTELVRVWDEAIGSLSNRSSFDQSAEGFAATQAAKVASDLKNSMLTSLAANAGAFPKEFGGSGPKKKPAPNDMRQRSIDYYDQIR